MITLIDNTLLHRVGAILETAPGAPIIAADLLAIFHFVEHLLFSDTILVSTFERPQTQERTARIADALRAEGVPGDVLTLVSFSVAEYAAACEAGSWSILDQLTATSAGKLRELGSLADESARPFGIQPWSFDFDDDKEPAAHDPAELGGPGTFRFVLKNDALRSRLKLLAGDSGGAFDLQQRAALTVLFRLMVNQELGRIRSALYAPAPQRARLSYTFDRLLRYQIEEALAAVSRDRRRGTFPVVLETLHSLDSLPLPALAIHCLRSLPSTSPQALIASACTARSTPEITGAREWLGKWELRMASADPQKRLDAMARLDSWSADVHAAVSASGSSVMAAIRPGVTAELDPTTGKASLSADMGDWTEPLVGIRRRLSKERRFLAAVSADLVTDSRLGAFLLRSINRTL
jgi:hypothetical protein